MLEIIEQQRLGDITHRRSSHKKGGNEIAVQVSAKLPLTSAEALESVASQHQLKLSQALRLIVLRGLAAYRRDGLLAEPTDIPRIEA